LANNNLKIDLHAREDKDNKIFYVGKLKAPANIELKNGATFLIFVADKGQEQLQIAPMEKSEKDKDHSGE
jgi:hypothetical protein